MADRDSNHRAFDLVDEATLKKRGLPRDPQAMLAAGRRHHLPPLYPHSGTKAAFSNSGHATLPDNGLHWVGAAVSAVSAISRLSPQHQSPLPDSRQTVWEVPNPDLCRLPHHGYSRGPLRGLRATGWLITTQGKQAGRIGSERPIASRRRVSPSRAR
jgi:hypothetical protein